MKSATIINCSRWKISIGLVLAVAVVNPAFAQGKKSKAQAAGTTAAASAPAEAAKAESSSGEIMKFKTDGEGPTLKSDQPAMSFTDGGATPLGEKAPSAFAETAPEEAPFKAYLGYPKHQISAMVMPTSLSSTWKYDDKSYSFTDNPMVFGVDYRLLITPMWNLKLEYSQYSSSVTTTTVTPYLIVESKKTFDDYSARMNYCFINRSTFYRQICPGFLIGNSSYPVLEFVSGARLEIGKVQDIVVGVDVNYQEPFSDKFLFKLGVGYNYGTGIGNSGSLTSKNNTSLVGNLGVSYQFATRHGLEAGVVMNKRTAKLSGKQGAIDREWNTDSTQLGGKFSYVFTF